MNKRTVLWCVAGVAASLAIGGIASMLQADSLQTWYPQLNKSSLNPPNVVFPVVWTILYIMSGISGGLVGAGQGFLRERALTLWVVQLVLNFAWSIVFFTMRSPAGGMVVILALVAVLAAYILTTLRSFKPSAYMFMPYLAWVAFATYLNGYILVHN